MDMKNKKGGLTSRQGGFIEIIIIIIVVLLLMKFFGITISGIFDWFTSFFRSVLR